MRKSFEVQSCSSLINRARRLSSRALAMDYSKNDFAGFKSRVPANWLRSETNSGVHFCYCLKFCRTQVYPKRQRFCGYA